MAEHRYRIKPEFMDYWGPDANNDTVITETDLEMIARGWDMDDSELMEQLIEEE